MDSEWIRDMDMSIQTEIVVGLPFPKKMVSLSRSSIPPKHHKLVPLEMDKLVMPQNCHVHDEAFLLPILVLPIVHPSRLCSDPSMVHVTVHLGRESVAVHLAEWCVLSLLMEACFPDTVVLPEAFMVRLSSNPPLPKSGASPLKENMTSIRFIKSNTIRTPHS
uniref:Uncharacterized protein n=1 Tax=Vitis vinifera TaxID=29760 RepID=A5BMM7_VITVI|nr:hypothetical protein VITISV_032425 [Vitis vinifera]